MTTVTERMAAGWRTAATGLRREFAAFLLLSVPIVLVAYALGVPEWVGTGVALLAIRVGAAPLNRWLRWMIRALGARRERSR